MALLADLSMKLLPELGCFGIVTLKDRNLMETMTVVAGSRIRVPCKNGFSMDTLSIAIILMTGGTFLNDSGLIAFPRGDFMNPCMTILALNVVDEMGTCIMLCPLFFMASVTGDRFGMNLCPFSLQMFLDICDIPVTTITRIGPMDGLGKLSFTDFRVAPEAFRVINAFIAVLSPPDDKLLSFYGFVRGFDHFRFRVLFLRRWFFNGQKGCAH